jgi:hypothetical protein
MIPMDKVEKWLPQLEASAKAYLRPDEYAQFEAIAKAEREAQITALLNAPIANFPPGTPPHLVKRTPCSGGDARKLSIDFQAYC